MFDAREWMKAVEPPLFVALDGTSYPGRVISLVEAVPLLQKLDAVAGADDIVPTVRAVCDAVGIPADEVLRLPVEGVLEAVRGFLQSGRRLTTAETRPTSGSV